MSHIVIIGGHGQIALKLAPLLKERGDSVTSLIRNPEHAADVEAAGARPVVVDVEHASTEELTAALSGADAVVWSAGAGGKGGAQRTYAVDRDAAIRSMDAAHAAGVRRYVMVSFNGSRSPLQIPKDHPLYDYAVAKLAADTHLVGTELEWTILGPGTLSDEPAADTVRVTPLGEGVSPDTSRGTVAKVAAAVLDQPATIRRVIPFVDGSTPITEAVADVPEEYSDIA
ncbi:putative sugar epimerase YhfK [Corynebacterium ciconiae DSM 44920]|uniref:SDR family oxidoreductase n=1 Tax=Corynebacterium ciconiae TaxID=227319 RepID=UPI0003667B1D|nr:SDR family oxidoreductase [Corynebacterium ciconiae]WKD60418.1 putative sugar epimerase YhfK [Corynebacterium ciconiae DSM 44920]